MAWTDPPTFVAGQPLPAADLNAYLRDNENYLKAAVDAITGSGVQVAREAEQNLADDTPENVNFDAERWDIGGWFPGSGTSITVPAGAIPPGFTSILVILAARVSFESDSNGRRRATFLKNGAKVGGNTYGAINGAQTEFTLVEFTTVEAGDVLQLEVNQTSGGGLHVTAANLSVVRLAPIS